MKSITFPQAVFLLMVLLKLGYNKPYTWVECFSVFFIIWLYEAILFVLDATGSSVKLKSLYLRAWLSIVTSIKYLVVKREIRKASRGKV